MEFVELTAFDNYIDAHTALGRLRQEYINCYLQDELSATIAPFLSNSIGGIKLMVVDTQVDRAREILSYNKGPGDTP
jgi:hypothetical protein